MAQPWKRCPQACEDSPEGRDVLVRIDEVRRWHLDPNRWLFQVTGRRGVP
jgi:hypothetical protein